MNNLSCHNPTGNVLGIYILSSRALDEPLQQSHTWHIFSPCPSAWSHTGKCFFFCLIVLGFFLGLDICINILGKQQIDERARWWLSSVVFRSHTSFPHCEGHTHTDSLRTIASMFTTDNLVSFQQLWGKLNLRKCSFSCPLDQTITLSPKVYKSICLQRTVQKINISLLSGNVRTK